MEHETPAEGHPVKNTRKNKPSTQSKPKKVEGVVYSSAHFDPRTLDEWVIYQELSHVIYKLSRQNIRYETMLLPPGTISALLRSVRRQGDVDKAFGWFINTHICEVEGLDSFVMLKEADPDKAVAEYALSQAHVGG